MKIHVGDPRIIHQGPAYEDSAWGVMQFPFVFKAKDGKIYVKMLALAENWATIGTRTSHIWFCSEDEGETWAQVDEPVGATGTELPNGESIYFPSRDAIILDPKEIKYWPGFTGQLPSDKPVKEPDDRSGLMNDPPQRPDFHQWCGSCCNVDLKPLDDNRAILIYSDFYVPDASGKTDKKHKSMMCRIITVEKD